MTKRSFEFMVVAMCILILGVPCRSSSIVPPDLSDDVAGIHSVAGITSAPGKQAGIIGRQLLGPALPNPALPGHLYLHLCGKWDTPENKEIRSGGTCHGHRHVTPSKERLETWPERKWLINRTDATAGSVIDCNICPKPLYFDNQYVSNLHVKRHLAQKGGCDHGMSMSCESYVYYDSTIIVDVKSVGAKRKFDQDGSDSQAHCTVGRLRIHSQYGTKVIAHFGNVHFNYIKLFVCLHPETNNSGCSSATPTCAVRKQILSCGFKAMSQNVITDCDTQMQEAAAVQA